MEVDDQIYLRVCLKILRNMNPRYRRGRFFVAERNLHVKRLRWRQGFASVERRRCNRSLPADLEIFVRFALGFMYVLEFQFIVFAGKDLGLSRGGRVVFPVPRLVRIWVEAETAGVGDHPLVCRGGSQGVDIAARIAGAEIEIDCTPALVCARTRFGNPLVRLLGRTVFLERSLPGLRLLFRITKAAPAAGGKEQRRFDAIGACCADQRFQGDGGQPMERNARVKGAFDGDDV